MEGHPELVVLRLGHRPGRDERMTTHVGLTARALGADRLVLAGDGASRRETIVEVTDRFGGPFDVETTDDPEGLLREWDTDDGTTRDDVDGETPPRGIVHLTMYGLPVQEVEADIRRSFGDGTALLVVVGAEKVPFSVYRRADWNVAVTNQPHSEVASLAVFLDHLFESAELDREWQDPDRVVVPEAEGKRVEDS